MVQPEKTETGSVAETEAVPDVVEGFPVEEGEQDVLDVLEVVGRHFFGQEGGRREEGHDA